MPAMTDPMEALRSFQPAFSAKQLTLQKGELDPTLWVHLDRPLGEPRFTYVRTRGKKVTALVVLTMAEPIDGVPCFAIGYAVPEDERRRGLAAGLINDAIAELQNGMARNGLRSFYVEAVIAKDNEASQKTAAATLTNDPGEGHDAVSGEPAFVYLRRYDAEKPRG